MVMGETGYVSLNTSMSRTYSCCSSFKAIDLTLGQDFVCYLFIDDVFQLQDQKRQCRAEVRCPYVELTLPFLHTPTTCPFSESTRSYASRGFSNISSSFKVLLVQQT